MKILLRHLFECPPVARWREFEDLLTDRLKELGHEVIRMELGDPAPEPDHDYKIHAHKNRNELPFKVGLFYKEMHIKGLFTVDTHGWGSVHSQSQAAPDLSRIDSHEARSFCESRCQTFLTDGFSRQLQPSIRPIAGAVKPYLFAPLQLISDDTIKHHSPIGVFRFIDILADWAHSRRVNVVFKLHPGREFPELNRAVERRVAASPYIFCLNENVHALILNSIGVCVINSGVGFEALIHGRPVITFGRSDYQWFTFRAHEGNLDEALAYIAAFGKQQRSRGYRFIQYYFRHHAYDTDDAVKEDTDRRLLGYLRDTLPAEPVEAAIQGDSARLRRRATDRPANGAHPHDGLVG